LLTAYESLYFQIPRRPENGSKGPFAGAVGRLRNNWQATKRQWNMIKVKSRGNETVDQMLRRFKKLCEKEGLIKDMKRVSYYEKPSEKRRRRMRKSQKRDLKAEIG
jgi:small subunit ribosomal protein S21